MALQQNGLAQKRTPLLLLLIFVFTNLFSQTPTTQDCLGAIPVCDYIYHEDSTASGFGNYFEIPNGGNNCPNGHCMDGEKNSRWYIFTVIQSGDLRFQITPQVQTDDYDWAVFNLTDHECGEIYSHPGWMMSSCNAAGGTGYQGTTGISSLNGGTSSCNNGGFTNKWNIDLPVYEGETYVLVVSDWTQTPGGYTLDFSASTAVIFDDQNPYIEYIGSDLITSCGTNELQIKFNENVKCSSIQPADFELTGPGGPYTIDSLYGYNCSLGGANEREYTLYFTPPIYQSGDYVLSIRQFSFISDACGNYAQVEDYPFTIVLDSPEAEAGDDINIPYATTAQLNGSATGGTGSFSYHWEPADSLVDPDIQNPETIPLTVSTRFTLQVTDTVSSCIGEDTVWVNVVGGPLFLTVSASTNQSCSGGRVDLNAFADGGAGSYSYNWSSNPPGFSSTEPNPSAFPEVSTTYSVTVTDGYTTLTDSVQVTVFPKPEADAGEDQVINEGTATTLNGSASGGTPPYTYQWEPASLLVQNNIPNPATYPLYDPTIFNLFVTDANNCEAEPDFVLVNPSGAGLSAFPLADPPEICLGDSTTINANVTGGGGQYTYSWTSYPAGFTSDQPSFTVSPITDTRYDLLVTDQYGNEYSAHVNVIVHPLPDIDLIPDNITPTGTDTITVCVRDTLTLDAGYDTDPPGTEYYWLENNFVSRFYSISTNGNWLDIQTHTVRVTNGLTGCQNTGRITVIFDFNSCEIGIKEDKWPMDESFNIFPNPNNGDFVLTFLHPLDGYDLNLFDVTGSVLYSENTNKKIPEGYKHNISLTGFSKGIYFLKISSGGNSAIKKIILR